MSEHVTTERLERYRQSALPPQEMLAVDDHLATCERCRAQMAEAVPAALPDDAWQTLRSRLHPGAEQIEHLSYEQLAALVDGQLGGEEIKRAESHLESCEMCAAELRDLRAFSLEVAALPQPEPQVSRTLPSAPLRSWRQRLHELLIVRWPVLAATAALLIVAAGVIYSRLRSDEPKPPDIAGVSPTPAPPSPTPTEVEGVSAAVLALNDGGGRITLDEKGNLIAGQPLPAGYEQMIKRALTTGRVETPPLIGLNVKTGSLMGGGENAPFKLLEPVAKVIESNQPRFRWQSLSGATSYTVTVYDANFTRVVTSQPLTATEWRASQALPRGAIYSWQVKAMKDGREVVVPEPPAPEAKFKVLEQSKAEELARARRQFADSHLTLGLLYAQAGMLGESERELRKLADANQSSPLARKLLRSVKSSAR